MADYALLIRPTCWCFRLIYRTRAPHNVTAAIRRPALPTSRGAQHAFQSLQGTVRYRHVADDAGCAGATEFEAGVARLQGARAPALDARKRQLLHVHWRWAAFVK